MKLLARSPTSSRGASPPRYLRSARRRKPGRARGSTGRVLRARRPGGAERVGVDTGAGAGRGRSVAARDRASAGDEAVAWLAASSQPPHSWRTPAGSKLDPFELDEASETATAGPPGPRTADHRVILATSRQDEQGGRRWSRARWVVESTMDVHAWLRDQETGLNHRLVAQYLLRWAVLGSNQRPPACRAGALPTELTAPVPADCSGRAAAPRSCPGRLDPRGCGRSEDLGAPRQRAPRKQAVAALDRAPAQLLDAPRLPQLRERDGAEVGGPESGHV